mmetsp:Transcript_100211/g.188872  ORF Transcript_100211/g.188872 Transcript_100211/m.188872 type:complete len:245 (-) Transcript_100211:314-1048(-)
MSHFQRHVVLVSSHEPNFCCFILAIIDQSVDHVTVTVHVWREACLDSLCQPVLRFSPQFGFYASFDHSIVARQIQIHFVFDSLHKPLLCFTILASFGTSRDHGVVQRDVLWKARLGSLGEELLRSFIVTLSAERIDHMDVVAKFWCEASFGSLCKQLLCFVDTAMDSAFGVGFDHGIVAFFVHLDVFFFHVRPPKLSPFPISCVDVRLEHKVVHRSQLLLCHAFLQILKHNISRLNVSFFCVLL